MNDTLNIYDQSFYSDQLDGSILSASIVVPLVLELFPDIESVVDVGCGVGTWLAEFKRNGVKTVCGYDGGKPPQDFLLIAQDEYHSTDLTAGFTSDMKFDLAVSLEVAEHLDKKFAPDFVSNICKLSDVVLFSAAPPGQGGTHHVNERWPSYWESLFGAEGYRFYDLIRPKIWYDRRIEWWYRQNIFLAVKQDRSDLTKKLGISLGESNNQIDIVHPEMFQSWRNAVQRQQGHGEQGELESVQLEYEALKNRLDAVLASTSWKLTTLPRMFIGKLKKILR